MTQPLPTAGREAPAEGLFARQAILDDKLSVVGYALVDRSSEPPAPSAMPRSCSRS